MKEKKKFSDLEAPSKEEINLDDEFAMDLAEEDMDMDSEEMAGGKYDDMIAELEEAGYVISKPEESEASDEMDEDDLLA